MTKEVYRMSQFWRDILWLILLVPLFILNIKFDVINTDLWPTQFAIGLILGILLFVRFLFIHMELDDAMNYKYKLVQKKYWYEAKVLKSWFFFIIFWQPIQEKFHSYKAQNIFGAKWDSCYTSEKTFKTEEKAREAIDKYKRNAKEQRREYFGKKKVTKFNKIKV